MFLDCPIDWFVGFYHILRTPEAAFQLVSFGAECRNKQTHAVWKCYLLVDLKRIIVLSDCKAN